MWVTTHTTKIDLEKLAGIVMYIRVVKEIMGIGMNWRNFSLFKQLI